MSLIKHYREQEKLTIRQLSEKSGVSVGYLSDLENDGAESINPSKDVMTKIASALNKTVPEVFFSSELNNTQRRRHEACT